MNYLTKKPEVSRWKKTYLLYVVCTDDPTGTSSKEAIKRTKKTMFNNHK